MIGVLLVLAGCADEAGGPPRTARAAVADSGPSDRDSAPHVAAPASPPEVPAECERALRRLRSVAPDIRERVIEVSTMEELDQWGISMNALERRVAYGWRGMNGFDPVAFRDDVARLTGLHVTCEAIQTRSPQGCDILAEVSPAELERCRDSLGFWGLLVGTMARGKRCGLAVARMTAPLVGADVDGLVAACEATKRGATVCDDDEVCRGRAEAMLAALQPGPADEDAQEALFRGLARGRAIDCSGAVENAYDSLMSRHMAGMPSRRPE